MTAAKERRRRHFVVALMLNPFALPALGGSILAAVVVGIHLGESSVGLINPIYFQGPALHPRDRGAALDERALVARAPAQGQLYGWEEGRAARAADCVDCDALQARDAHVYSAEVPYFGGRGEARAPAVETRYDSYAAPDEYEAAPAEQVVEPKSPILRYAYYPVEEPVVEAEPEMATDEKYYAE